MAETKVSGRDYILLADIDGDATFKPVACLTTNSFTSTNDTIDATSKCGNSYTPSPVFSQSFDCEGFAIDETGTPSKDSYQQLYAAHAAETGDKLILGLNTDQSVQALKGPTRPVINEHDRARVLAALESVDAVILEVALI